MTRMVDALRRTLEHRAFVPVLAVVCGIAAFAIAQKNIVGRTSDFAIYLEVAREFRAGGFDLFRERAATGPWLYPHCVVLPFAAAQFLFEDRTLVWIWCALLALGTADIVRSLAALGARIGRLGALQWLVFAVLFQRCIAQNSTHGQLSLFVGVAVLRGIIALLDERPMRGGAWLALAGVLKLSPLLFVPALPFLRRFRAAAAMALCAGLAVFVLPWPFCGTEEHLRHLDDFVRGIRASTASTDGASPLLRNYAGASVQGAFDYLLQPRPFDADGRTVNIANVSDAALRTIELAWSALLATLLGAWFLRARRLPERERLVQQCAAVLMATAFFTPLVRVYHLVAALVPFVLFCRGPRTRGDTLWWITAAGFLFAMTARQKNLLGETLWRAFDTGALLHGCLVAMVVWLMRGTGRETAQTEDQ